MQKTGELVPTTTQIALFWLVVTREGVSEENGRADEHFQIMQIQKCPWKNNVFQGVVGTRECVREIGFHAICRQ